MALSSFFFYSEAICAAFFFETAFDLPDLVLPPAAFRNYSRTLSSVFTLLAFASVSGDLSINCDSSSHVSHFLFQPGQ